MTISLAEDLKLRKIGRKYMIVRTIADKTDMSDVFTLNESAAYLWDRIASEGGSADSALLPQWLVEGYGISLEVASADVEAMLREWKEFGLVTGSEE